MPNSRFPRPPSHAKDLKKSAMALYSGSCSVGWLVGWLQRWADRNVTLAFEDAQVTKTEMSPNLKCH